MSSKIKKVLLIGSALISINACAKPTISLTDTSAKIVYRLKTNANNSINLYGISKNNMPEFLAVNCTVKNLDLKCIREAFWRFIRKIFGLK